MISHHTRATRHFSGLLALAVGVFQPCCAAPGPRRRPAVWQLALSRVVVIVDNSSSEWRRSQELESRLDTVLDHCLRDRRPVVVICTAGAPEAPACTVYPILARLEREHGWVTSRWEDIASQDEGRPRRRYYKLTEDGAERALSELPAGPRTIDSATDPSGRCCGAGRYGLQSRRANPRRQPGRHPVLNRRALVSSGPRRLGHPHRDRPRQACTAMAS